MNNLGNNKTMADNLIYYMNRKGVSRVDMCRDLGFKYTTLTGWITAEKYPRIDKIEIMANYFGISKADLVEEKSDTQKSARIPVLGRIPAGVPFEAIEYIIDYEEIPYEWTAGGKEYFALKIAGNSMSDKYQNGDIVIFLKSDDCDSGAECAVMVNGDDATFKKVVKQESGVILQPLNINEYEPTFYSDREIDELPVRLLGIAKEIRRKA